MSVINQKKQTLTQLKSKIFQRFLPKKSDKQKTGNKLSVPKLIFKITMWIFGVCFALVLLVVIFLDPILHFSVTKVGSMATGLDVSVGNIELSLLSGDFKITNLKVSNPEGFDSTEMLDLGTFYISWDINSVFTDEIIVKNIEVRNLYINAQVNQSGKLNFLALAENFAAPPEENDDTVPEPENDEENEFQNDDSQKKLWVEKFSIVNFHFAWIDKREEFNIHGFGVDLEELSGSITEGSIKVNSLKITNPETYAISDLLSIESISVVFAPETIYTASPIINNAKISGMTACAEFNQSGDFNVLDIIDSLQDTFPPSEDESANDPDIASETDNPVADSPSSTNQEGVKLQEFTLENSWFHLEDDRIKVPVKIPLYYSVREYSLFDNIEMDMEILPYLHKYAVWLRDTCAGVTDADQLALNFVKSAAKFGFSVFSKAGGVIIDGGEILIDGGGKLLDGTKNSGKKVVDGIVDIFK